MDTNELADQAQDLANTETSLRLDAGDVHTRIRLLELALADSVRLTHRLTTTLLELTNKVEELDSKLEDYRLYGFHHSAEDE